MATCLDLFCCAGGAGEGYRRAGFEVTGVDIEPQPHNPHRFIQGDALEFLREHGGEFDFIHASPPCQRHSTMTRGLWKNRIEKHANLIGPTREALKAIGRPYVIENVEGARGLLVNPVLLCGTMFGLKAGGDHLRRHRYFECSFGMPLTPPCNHGVGGRAIGVWGHAGGSSRRDGLVQHNTAQRKEAMGIDWMTGDELSEAIPPAYTEFIGRQWFALHGVCPEKTGEPNE